MKKPPQAQGHKNLIVSSSQFTADNISDLGYVSTPIASSVVDFDSYQTVSAYQQQHFPPNAFLQNRSGDKVPSRDRKSVV